MTSLRQAKTGRPRPLEGQDCAKPQVPLLQAGPCAPANEIPRLGRLGGRGIGFHPRCSSRHGHGLNQFDRKLKIALTLPAGGVTPFPPVNANGLLENHPDRKKKMSLTFLFPSWL